MKFVTIKYQVMGIGDWVSATVSKDVAERLQDEYTGYGWPVKLIEE
ncbi:hypothetical protein [Vibrio maerlii]|nr:hypothetical protein [Vibrio maerlii]